MKLYMKKSYKENADGELLTIIEVFHSRPSYPFEIVWEEVDYAKC